MSSEIDKRIVDMELRKDKFQSDAEETIKTLGKLEDSLDFKSGVGKSIDTIASKFTNFGIIGHGVLQNITTDVYNLGKSFVKSLTVDQITAGFGEYELNIGSMQAIMSSTGASADEVSKHLDSLNEYADKTIYSFSDMASNIHKFTNAGVELTPAVNAMKGIANLTALSGGNTQQASSAMYNFSQALSMGYMGLLDWKSIAQTANLGTVEFKNELIKTAIDMGTLVKQGNKYVSTTKDLTGSTSNAFDATKGFEQSLKSQWLTAEVLTKVLNEYGDETTDIGKKAFKAATEVKTFSHMIGSLKESAGSGWAQTMKILFGNYDDAVKLWTGLFNRIDGWMSSVSDKRNDVLRAWAGFGGRDAMVESLNNVLTALETLTKPMSRAIDKLLGYNKGWRVLEHLTDTVDLGPLGNATYESMVLASKGIQKFTESLIPSEDTIEKLSNVLTGLISIIRFVVGLLKPVGAGVFGVIKVVSPLFKILLAVLSLLGRITTRLVDAASKSPAVQQAVKIISESFDSLYEKINSFSDSAVKVIDGFLGENEDIFEKIEKTISDFNLDGLESVVSKIKEFFGKIIDSFKTKKLEEDFENVSSSANRVLAAGFGGIIDTIYAFIEKIFSFDFETLLNIGIASGIIAGIARIVKGVKAFDKVIAGATGIMDSVGEIGEMAKKAVKQSLKSIKVFTRGFGDTLKSLALDLKADAFLKMSLAITVLVGSLYLLTKLDTEKVNNSVKVILIICAGLSLVALAIGKAGSMLLDTNKAFNDAIVGFTKDLGSTVKGALNGVKAIFTSFSSIFSSIASSIKMVGISVLIASFGLLFLEIVAAIGILSKIDAPSFTNILKGVGVALLAFAAVLGIVYASFRFINESQNINVKSITKMLFTVLALSSGLIVFGGALASLAVGLLALKKVGIESIASNLGLVGAFLIVFGYASEPMEKASKTLPKAFGSVILFSIGLTVLASALKAISDPLKELSSIPFTGVLSAITSVLGLFGIMVLMSVSSPLIKKTAKNIPDLTLAFLVLTGALYSFKDVIVPLSELSWEQIAKGLAAISASLLIVLGVLAILGSMPKKIKIGAKTMLPLVGSILLLSSALVALAVPIKLFSMINVPDIYHGLVGMAMAITSLLAAVLILGGLSKIMKKGLTLLPALSGCLALLATAMALLSVPIFLLGSLKTETLSKGIVALGAAFLSAATGMIVMSLAAKVIGENAKNLAKFGLAFAALGAAVAVISIIAPVIVKNADLIAEAIGVLVDSVVIAIQDSADAIVNVVLDIIVEVLDALVRYVPTILIQLEEIIIECLDWLIEAVPDFVDRICQAIGMLFSEVVKGMDKYIDPKDALIALGSLEVIYVLIKQLIDLKDSIKDAIPAVIMMGALLAMLVIAFGSMSYIGIDGKNMAAQAVAIGITVLAFTPLLKALGKFHALSRGLKWKSVATILTMMGGVMVELGLVFLALDKLKIDSSNALNIAKALAYGFIALIPLVIILGGAIAVLGKLHLDPATILTTGLSILAVISVAVLIMTGIMGLIGSINMLTGGGFEDALRESIGVFGAIGEAIGALVGSLVGAIAEGTLNLLGTGLSEFAQNAQPFLDAVGKLDPEFESKVTSLGAGVIALASAGFINAIGDLVSLITGGGGSLSDLGKDLAGFGPYLNQFIASCSDIDESKAAGVKTAGEAVKTIVDAMPKEGGVVQWWTGTANMEDFATNMGAVGKALIDFQNNTKGLNPLTVQLATKTGEVITAFCDKLPKEGGVVQKWTGEINMAKFSENLPKLGTSIMDFQKAVSDEKGNSAINSDSVQVAVKAAELLSSLNNGLPATGGKLQAWTGEKSLDQFASNLLTLGTAIVDFNNAVTDENGSKINEQSIRTAVWVGEEVVGLWNAMPDSDGFMAWASGFADLEDFAANLPFLGTGIKSFADSTSGINTSGVSFAVSAMESIVGLQTTLKGDNDSFWDIWKDKERLTKFAEAVPKLGEGIKGLSDKMNGAELKRIEVAAYAIKALADVTRLQNELGGLSIDAFDKAISNLDFSVITSQAEAVANNSMFAETAKKFKEIGKGYIQNLYEGMEGTDSQSVAVRKSALIKALQPVIDGLSVNSSTYKSYTSNPFVQAGGYMVDGICSGLTDYYAQTKLTKTANQLVNYTILKIEQAAEIASPSKRTARDGKYMVEGLSVGMLKNISLVSDAGGEVSNEAIDALTKGMGDVSRLLSDEDFDMSPTITPIVDMTNIRNSAGQMNDLFSSQTVKVRKVIPGATSLKMARGVKMETENGNRADISRSAILETVKRIGSKLDGLESKMDKMKVVLDSGELVGGMTPKLMRSIKRQQTNISRGVIPSVIR